MCLEPEAPRMCLYSIFKAGIRVTSVSLRQFEEANAIWSVNAVAEYDIMDIQDFELARSLVCSVTAGGAGKVDGG